MYTNGGKKPTAFPTFATPFPTDDETYPPTFVVAEYDGDGVWKNGSWNDAFPESWATTSDGDVEETSSLTNIAEDDDEGGGVGGGMRRLLEKGSGQGRKSYTGLDKWTSIHPNDEFFVRFPEFLSRQEEIYRLRNILPAGRADRRRAAKSRTLVVDDGSRAFASRRDLAMRGAGPTSDRQVDDDGGGMTIADIASANNDFSILLAAATAAGFQDILAGTEPMTVFGASCAIF